MKKMILLLLLVWCCSCEDVAHIIAMEEKLHTSIDSLRCEDDMLVLAEPEYAYLVRRLARQEGTMTFGELVYCVTGSDGAYKLSLEDAVLTVDVQDIAASPAGGTIHLLTVQKKCR